MVIQKDYREPFTSDAIVDLGRGLLDYGSGMVAERWVLVVKDKTGGFHHLNVDQQIWEKHRIGDSITAENPLVNLP